MVRRIVAIFMAILAVGFWNKFNCIRLLLVEIPSTLMASLLYLGAGIGILVIYIVKETW